MMKRNKIFAFFMVCCITVNLSACQKKADIVYEDTFPLQGLTSVSTDTFASDLCVVPLNHKEKKNGNFEAASTLIFDAASQEVLRADNVYKKLYPASVTKIMTAYVILKYANLEDTVTFSYDASHIMEWGAKLCGFQKGDQINLHDLLAAFLVYSGNDAGIALAEHVSGSVEEFAKLMNQEAKALGATNSHFVNPHGLHDDDHYTTTYDIYLIFNALIQDERFVDLIHKKQVKVKYTTADKKKATKTFLNTNRYINGKLDPPDGVTVIGGKTGTTFKAGSCLVLYSQDKKKHDYISIVFKAQSSDTLFNQMSELLEMIDK